MEIVSYILMFFYYFIPMYVVFKKQDLVWKGICRGNGVPQMNEAVMALAAFGFWFELGNHFFFEKEVSIALLTLILGAVGITSFSPDKKMEKH